MKATMIILVVAAGLALQAAAASPDNHPSASTNLRENTKRPFYEFWKPKTAPTYKIERYGRISSRPWAQIAGQPAPALFVDQRVYSPNFPLFWAGASPK